MCMQTFKKRMKNNTRLKKRVKWYKLGQRRCHCCGVQMTWGNDTNDRVASAEHMIPKSKGGTLHDFNVLIICRKCNNNRKNKDWIQFVTENQFPKSNWLITKYLESIEQSLGQGLKIHKDVLRNAKTYNMKEAA